MTTFTERESGILLHPTSLPGPFGTGDLGPAAHRFLEFLARAGQSFWQMLPIGPVGNSASPYDSASSFAGNPLLISLEDLSRAGYLEPSELNAHPRLARARSAMYSASNRFRAERLQRAFARFEQGRLEAERKELSRFRERSQNWLPDYALYQALKRAHRGLPWTAWEPALRDREPEALEQARRKLDAEVRYQEFLQFIFDRQWSQLYARAHELGVKLMGDIPMFVAHDGADVWSNRQCFVLDEKGEQRVVAGVPPDYFNPEGQRWGNPVYNWDELERSGYAWWLQRLKATLARFDAVRLDHFIGFHHYWEIPAHTASAREGRFVKVPGADFFARVREVLGSLPFIAEDLGLVIPEVQKLRDQFELPGMRVLQFGFSEEHNDYQPHRYTQRSVVYTGTHDTDTLLGWLTAYQRAQNPQERAQLLRERERILSYAGSDGTAAHWDIVRLALSSVAELAIFPIQDILGQGNWARMNVPGTCHGNWRFRLSASDLDEATEQRLRALCEIYERVPRSRRRANPG